MYSRTKKTGKAWRILLLLSAVVIAANAGDGVIEINQAKALAGGVTPGDTEGFPVTISESGSFWLTGGLTVPDENTTAIQITADHVSIDLNASRFWGRQPPGRASGSNRQTRESASSTAP